MTSAATVVITQPPAMSVLVQAPVMMTVVISPVSLGADAFVPSTALTLAGQPITLAGHYLTLSATA
jgi:hypothetical protein